MKLFLSAIFVCFISICNAQNNFTLSALKDSIRTILDEEHLPGLMVALVTKDSIIWTGGVGLANITSKTKVNENHLFRIGSITKSFTALAVLKLIEQGKFTLHSKLVDLAPEIPFTNKWEKASPVRIINLLEHTAGFDDMHFAAFIDKDGLKKSTLNQALAHVNAFHSRWRPGTRMSYSNPGYAILGYIVEKYSGVTYEEYIARTIFRPLGMAHSGFDYQTTEPYATGYSFNGSYHQALAIEINGNAAGGVSTCAKDMANYVRFYLNDGNVGNLQIFSRESIREMERTHSTIAAQYGMDAGYGLANSTKMIGDGPVKEIFRGHDGGMLGFGSDFAYSRTWGIGYAICNNGESGNNKIINKIFDFLMQGRSSELPASKPLDKEAIAPFLGTYKAMAPRNQILSLIEDVVSTTDVFIKNDTLYYQPFLGERKSLLPVLGNQYRNSDCLIPTSIFIQEGDAKVFFLDRSYMGKINPVPLWILRFAIGVSLLLGILQVPFSMAWLIMLYRKKLKRKGFMVRIFPLLAFISFGVLLYAFIDFTSSLSNMITGGSVNFHTSTIFVSSLLFPAFSIIAIYSIIRSFNTVRSGFIKYFLLLSSLGACFFSLYLLYYGWLGLRIWAY